MDYRALLFKYMTHVSDCESIDYTDRRFESEVRFTNEEWGELLRISAEIENGPNRAERGGFVPFGQMLPLR